MNIQTIEAVVNEVIDNFKSGKMGDKFQYGITYQEGKFYSMTVGGLKEITESRAKETIVFIEGTFNEL
jgi:hypothetical protein